MYCMLGLADDSDVLDYGKGSAMTIGKRRGMQDAALIEKSQYLTKIFLSSQAKPCWHRLPGIVPYEENPHLALVSERSPYRSDILDSEYYIRLARLSSRAAQIVGVRG